MVLAVNKAASLSLPGSAGKAAIERLTRFLAANLGTETVELLACERLEGGAVQENWRLRIGYPSWDRTREESYVLRTRAVTGLPDSRPKGQEFAILKAAWKAGVLVPEPLWVCEDSQIIGAAFLLVREVRGTARGRSITASAPGKDGSPTLAAELARQLARIHAIVQLPPELAFLRDEGEATAEAVLRHWRTRLDELPDTWPALEWGFRWCETHLPAPSARPSLVHGDFRTGNYLLSNGRLRAILDWEFCQWGDPMSDIGWFCAACWRFDRPDLEAGGIASRTAFYRAYEDASGQRIDRDSVLFWEVLAHIRWAVIAVQQGLRFYQGGETSLDLGLTGRLRPAQIQLQLLKTIPPAAWRRRDGPAGAGAPEREPGRWKSRRNDKVMRNTQASRQLLSSAAEVFRKQILPALPPNQCDNGRMVGEALESVLRDLTSGGDGGGLNDPSLAESIRNGGRDGDEATHLDLLEAVSAELKAQKPG